MARRRRRARLPEPRVVGIEKMSHDGRGIARVDGKTVFVFAALAGETVAIRYIRTSRKFDEAVVSELIEASDKRIEARCEAFDRCGGCSLQHLGGEHQIELKQQALLEMIEHAGLVAENILTPLIGPGWGYRRKARLGVKYVAAKQRVLVGFRERYSAYIADMERCEVLIPKVGEGLTRLSEMIARLEARARIPQIEVAADDHCTQLVFRHLDPLSPADIGILTEFAKTEGFAIQLQPGGPDSIVNLYPSEQNLSFSPHPGSAIEIAFAAQDFVQVNTEINQRMVAQALSLLAPEADDELLDLFCGLGNFTLPLAKHCARITGVEGDSAMVARAGQAARANNIHNSKYFAADLTQIDADGPWMRRRYDRILLDPPRSGAAEISGIIGKLGASRILYVSCQASSLVRDAAMICGQGYRLSHLGVMDMFPQTAHIESMAVFDRIAGEGQ